MEINFTIFDQKISFKFFWKCKNYMTYRFAVNARNNCTVLLDNNFGKETIHKIILDFIYFDWKYVTI